MITFTFDLPKDENVIIVNASIEGKFEFRLVLDTAATHTTIDSNVLYFSGYELKNSKGEKEIETSNGIIVVETYDWIFRSKRGPLKIALKSPLYLNCHF